MFRDFKSRMRLYDVESRFVLISLVAIGIWDACRGDSCNPIDECSLSGTGTKVPDPKDCHNYYVCIEDAQGNVGPSDQVFECDSGYYFSDYYGRCEYGSCTNTCSNICRLSCSGYDFESYADTESCNVFYTCYPSGVTAQFFCPEDAPYFDGIMCTNNKFDCCDPCLPYCSSEFTETLDPFDCRSYYFCSEVGVPPEENHLQCPAGEYFDPERGVCHFEESPCESICSTNSTLSVKPN